MTLQEKLETIGGCGDMNTNAELDQLVAHLVNEHVASCIAIGRDPGDYTSQWSRYADALAAVRGERDRYRVALQIIIKKYRHSWVCSDIVRQARQALGDTHD
jgi:hypothetical protein